jgi:hypothetical protein
VVGFVDVPMASFVRPTLTTIAVPTYEMGQAAMGLLLEMFNGAAGNEPVLMPGSWCEAAALRRRPAVRPGALKRWAAEEQIDLAVGFGPSSASSAMRGGHERS